MGDRAIRIAGQLNDAANMLRWLIVAIALAATALVPGEARAWGFYAHGVTAQIAETNLSPHAQREIARLLRAEALLGTPECRVRTLAEASVWPDCIRRDGWRWGYTFAWHYRTTPICEDYNPRANCAGGNCVTAQIERSQRVLADERLPAHVRLEALAFLVHFAGDLHMPLHSGDKDDRGANDREAAYGIAPGLNLHWIWDGPLAERAISSSEDPLVRRYSADERAALGGGTPADWGRESWQLARDFVYPNAFDQAACPAQLPSETALTQEDIVEALPVVRQRVRQAGIRIAELLESAFAPGPLPIPERAPR